MSIFCLFIREMKKNILFVLFLIFVSLSVSAQTKYRVHGTVTDLNGVPVADAAVDVRDSADGAYTDERVIILLC